MFTYQLLSAALINNINIFNLINHFSTQIHSLLFINGKYLVPSQIPPPFHALFTTDFCQFRLTDVFRSIFNQAPPSRKELTMSSRHPEISKSKNQKNCFCCLLNAVDNCRTGYSLDSADHCLNITVRRVLPQLSVFPASHIS